MLIRLLRGVCVAWLLAAGGAAQTGKPLPELVTDRPDFTEATDVVGRGVLQLEGGFTLDREGSVRHFSGPELLLRLGLSKRFELRFATDGFDANEAVGQNWRSGHSDAEIGFKLNFWKQGHYRPAFSIVPNLSIPVGSAAFSSGGYDPTLKLAWSKDLPKGFTLGGNINFLSLRAESGRIVQKAWSTSLGHDLPGGFAAYWEVYGFSPWDGPANAWIANTGISHGVGDNAQWDVRVGRRITAAGPAWFFGAGFAIRKPTPLFVR